MKLNENFLTSKSASRTKLSKRLPQQFRQAESFLIKVIIQLWSKKAEINFQLFEYGISINCDKENHAVESEKTFLLI